jgi:hypothetical protein
MKIVDLQNQMIRWLSAAGYFHFHILASHFFEHMKIIPFIRIALVCICVGMGIHALIERYSKKNFDFPPALMLCYFLIALGLIITIIAENGKKRR